MKWLLDSGDPNEFREISDLLASKNEILWGATTNPSLIAKKLSGKKLTQKELYEQQKELVLEILGIVPGAVSAEVYADKNTGFEQMVEQGLEISKWHERVVVKLPTTAEGFKARTQLRKRGVIINNTLVFSQQQIFAICLHEKIIQQTFNPQAGDFPPFISPFVGRLDDQNEDGMELVEYGMNIKEGFEFELWMLESSVRKVEHVKRGLEAHSELATIPAKVYKEWLALSDHQKDSLDPNSYAESLQAIEQWNPSSKLLQISTIEELDSAISTKELDIAHSLTDTGIERFSADWNALITN